MNDKKHVSNQRGRPINFSREKLVETVTELFWEDGYNAISLNKVANNMGLNRSSLYNSFKSKEELFLECLEYYSSRSPTAKFRNYEAGQNIGRLLYEVLDEICELRSKDKNNRGCLAANAFNELSNKKTPLGKKLLKRNARSKKVMITLIEQAVIQNELPKDTDASIIAYIILSFMSGLNAHAKSGVSAKELKKMCHVFLQKIGFTDF